MTSSQALWALLAILVVQAVTDAAVLVLGTRSRLVMRALPLLVSGAAGVLLATACLDLLPEAVHSSEDNSTVWLVFLLSLLALFCVQTFAQGVGQVAVPPSQSPHLSASTSITANSVTALDSHSHAHVGIAQRTSTMPLLVASALHSGVDGLAIAAAFAVGKAPGWSAAIAVTLHEFPHRLSDYSVLLHKGIAPRKAAKQAILAGSAAIAGGLAIVVLGRYAQGARWLLPVSAASFLYIALVDLLPEIQSRRETGRMWWELACLLGGAALIAALIHNPGE